LASEENEEKNLFINIAKGYSPREFLQWVREEARVYGVNEDQLALG
jgi:hypothetical protein